MLKPYNELREVDISGFVKERDGFKYLSWAKCIELLYEHGAEKVSFLPLTNPNGSSLFMSDQVFTDKNGVSNRVYETRIEIFIDDKIYTMQSPIMNGANPVKDNSMSQQRLWNAQCRAFVKGVAIYTGLGFGLWLEEEDKNLEQSIKNDNMRHDILKVRDAVFERVTFLQKTQNYTMEDIANKIGRTRDELELYLKQYKILYEIEYKLFKEIE